MVNREYWLQKIDAAWQKRSIIWLPGVRRAGKTSICKSIRKAKYFDCELPRVRNILETDPEEFLNNEKGERIILDEIHRLKNPSEILKIAADHYPNTKIIATGSSTLAASKKFKDTLIGRKIKIWLSPMLNAESDVFGNNNLSHRLLHGGLPPFFLETEIPDEYFVEWLDDYWAKDIQTLFNIANKNTFQKFTELVLANSGNIFEASKYAAPCEVSRTTINKYLYILEQTYVAHIIKPYTSYATTEIISAPKVYGFDTGFICYYKGWLNLRNDDYGYLFEHIVLNEMLAKLSKGKIKYWRSKAKHEIDFIYTEHRNSAPITIECKWSANNFNSKNLHKFRSLYSKGLNFVVAHDIDNSFIKNVDGLKVKFVNLEQLITELLSLKAIKTG